MRQIEQILDLQMDMHKYYSSEKGQKGLTLLLGSIGNMDKLTDLIWENPEISVADKISLAHKFVELAGNLPKHLYRGDCLFVTKDILQVCAKASEDMPQDISLDEMELLCPFGFSIFENSLELLDINGVTVTLCGFAWGLDPDVEWRHGTTDDPIRGIHIWFLTDDDETPEDRKLAVPTRIQLEHWYPYGFGAQLPWEDKQGSVKPWLRLFFALQLLARQELSEVRSQDAPRPARKRASHWRPEPGYISVITLRHKVIKGGEGNGKIEHQYRWMVGGHWRRQWYPSLNKHQWKYIAEYIKGPKDKPLVIRERRIFNFRR